MSSIVSLERVLREEEQAQMMAAHIGAVTRRHDVAEIARELAALRAFLLGDFEVHLQREEQDLFPHLAERGLAIEVDEAKRQHGELRRMRDELGAIGESEGDRLRAALRRISDELIQHLRYEADFLYVDLTRDEAAVFREHVDAALTGPEDAP
jgi:iron-sulfur cluster repair protein YtfE (RIC family)